MHNSTAFYLFYIIKIFILGASGIWGVIAIGLFADNPYPLDTTSGRSGLFKGLYGIYICYEIFCEY